MPWSQNEIRFCKKPNKKKTLTNQLITPVHKLPREDCSITEFRLSFYWLPMKLACLRRFCTGTADVIVSCGSHSRHFYSGIEGEGHVNACQLENNLSLVSAVNYLSVVLANRWFSYWRSRLNVIINLVHKRSAMICVFCFDIMWG